MSCDTKRSEDLILTSLADLDNKFEKFRENTAERLARLERKPRRSADADEDGIGRWMHWIFICAIVVTLAPTVLEFLARLRAKEKSHGHLSLSQA